MTAPIIAACLWVLAATVVAFLPMRVQRVLGLPLVAAAAVLIVWLSRAVSPWIGVAALAAFVSMFRRPLGHLAARLRGKDRV